MVKIARCGCTAGACGCVIQADNTTTTCIDMAVSADPGSPDFPIKISATPVVDPAAGNLLSCEPGGLRADITVTDSVCVDFSGNGSPASPLSATLVFDPDTEDCLNCGPQGVEIVIDPGVDNALECGALGLYVANIVTANRQTASYTLALGDMKKVVEMEVATANDLTVPPNASVAFPIGTVIEIMQYGAGQTTIVAGVGVTLRSPGGKLKIALQYGAASLRKIATDEWAVEGNLTT